MPKKTVKLSIVIVHYKAKSELFDCLDSIKSSNSKVSYEVIVVDNDEEKIIEKELAGNFPWVYYIKSPGNIGYGAGNNLGAKQAKGDYLFFLNPDTIVFNSSIDTLLHFLDRNKETGIVAPILLDAQKKPYPLQGSSILTPLKAIVCLSFVNKLFPKNPIARNYWMMDWDKKTIKEADVAPGTALMIRRKIFENIGGFDERFFLFFEEDDICMRVRKLGYHIYINPQAKAVHLWGSSTKKTKNLDKTFKKSRFLYFQKHFGIFWALVVELFTR